MSDTELAERGLTPGVKNMTEQTVELAWIPMTLRQPRPEKIVLARFAPSANEWPSWAQLMWVPAKYLGEYDGDVAMYDEESDTYYAPEGWYQYAQPWADYTWAHVGPSEIVTHWAAVTLPDVAGPRP